MIAIDQKWFSSLTQIGGGGTVLVSFSADQPKSRFDQPWRTVPSFNPNEGRWEARVFPGFVNAEAPMAFGYLLDDPAPVPRDVPLDDEPFIVLNGFRSIPSEGDPVPGFFAPLGVRTPRDNIEISEVGGVVIDETGEDPALPAPRQLVAMDFYVAVARATYRSSAQAVDPSGLTGNTVLYSVTFDTSRFDLVGPRPRLMQAPKFPEVKAPTLVERLLGLTQDEGEDRILISTVYLLSPENYAGPVDANWTPYVKHGCFWNLCHAARNLPPQKQLEPIRLFTGLALGLGDIVGNQILSQINDYSQQVLNAVNTTTNAGKFWSI